VALESSVLAQGLPFPANLELSRTLCGLISKEGAEARTVGIIDGELKVGLSAEEILRMCSNSPTDRGSTTGGEVGSVSKVSLKDMPIIMAQRATGATTVASTMRAAYLHGIRVMATGGIGGVHRGMDAEALFDVSADLYELASTPLTVVCAGPKAVLHLAATRERLESLGIPVIGWKTDKMPAFYCGQSPHNVDTRCDSVEEVVRIVRARDELQMRQSVLVCVPLPESMALSYDRVERSVAAALHAEQARDLTPSQITPYLLDAIRSEIGEAALTANVELLKQNARLAARLAVALADGTATTTTN
jgi:pseudouridine-5'-phosphate glycosidase